MNVELKEHTNTISKRTEDLEKDIQNAFEVMKELEDY